MKPGPELDALVDEKVMGGVKSHPEHYWFRNSSDGLPDLPAPEGQGPVFAGPKYSTDIKAAWEVVGVFLGDAPTIAFANGSWSCEFQSPDGLVESNFCESAPHAICLAALKAVGVEVPA